MSSLLLSKISGVRHKHVGVAWATGIFAIAGAIFVLLGTGMILDWWLNLPRIVRAIFLLVDLGGLVYLVVRFIAIPVVYGPDDEEIALWVEDAEPSFSTRLIASIQFARPSAIPAGASVSLVRNMIHQAETLAHDIDFNNVVRTEQLIRFIIVAGLAFLVFAGGFAWGLQSNTSTALLERAFLMNVPVPRRTRIEVIDPNKVIPRGNTVSLVAKASGSIPINGQVHVKFASARVQTFAMTSSKEDSASFTCNLDNVQDSFQYYVHLGDADTDWFHVTALPRPMATKIEVTQIYPPYTGHKPEVRALGDLTILQGSRLRLSVMANNPCSSEYGQNGEHNHFHLAGCEQDFPLELDTQNARMLHGEAELPNNTTGFFVQLVDEKHMASKDSAVYRIDMVPHKPPTVRIVWPERKEELYTRVGRVRIGFVAVDEYGIAALSLKYKLDDGKEQTVAMDLGGVMQPTWARSFEWDLSKITPASTTRPSLEGSTLEYWMEAVNNNTKSGPGKGTSEHYSVRVVTEAEKRAELAARFAASVQEADEIRVNEEKINASIGKPILEQK